MYAEDGRCERGVVVRMLQDTKIDCILTTILLYIYSYEI